MRTFLANFPFTNEVFTHEFGHAYTDRLLEYAGESGALNESISDVFAITQKQCSSNMSQADTDWMIGRDFYVTPDGDICGAMRSMSDPGSAFSGHPIMGSDKQPKHYRDIVHTPTDHGGVHTNSGIPNYAFYLAATEIGGPSWERPLQIWYSALQEVQWEEDFSHFAQKTCNKAGSLFTAGDQDIVGRAWMTVGVELPKK